MIFGLGLMLVLNQIKADLEQEIYDKNKTAIMMFEEEISEGSIELAYFTHVNRGKVLKLLTDYYDKDISNKAYLSTQLIQLYNMRFIQSKYLVSNDAYMKNGEQYSFEHYGLNSVSTVENMKWYQDAITNPDKVRVNVAHKDDVLTRKQGVINENILIFSLVFDKLSAGHDVNSIHMCIMSDAINYIETIDESNDGIEMAVLDEDGEILVSSSGRYNDEILEIYQLGQTQNREIIHVTNQIQRMGWSIITLANGRTNTENYRDIIFLMLFSVIFIFIILCYVINRMLRGISNPINQLSRTMQEVSNDTGLQKCDLDGLYEIEVIKNTYNNMIDEIEQLIMVNNEKERQKHEEEMKVLELQINPHFLSNTLSTIRFMAMVTHFEGIQKMTESLMDILEVSFRNSDSFHVLKEEIKITEAYIYIMQIRYSSNFEVEYIIDNTIKDILVPKLILQPILENAIVHGFSEASEIGHIVITIKKNESRIEFEVYDDGIGIEENKIPEMINKLPENGKKIGIANTNKRLKLYYGEEYGLNIISVQNEFTKVSFAVPYLD